MKIIPGFAAGLTLLLASLLVVQADEKPAASAQPPEDNNDLARSKNAELLFVGRCVTCHQLPEPGMLTPKQWKLILGTMQQRMQQAGLPPLSEEETELVLEYLTARAR